MGDNERRRRRQRHPADRPVPAPPPSDPDDGLPSATTPEVHDPAPPPAPRRPDPSESRPRRPAGPRPMGGLPPSEEREAERGLRGLVGSGASQVGITAAMRARDASRPSAAEEAQAMERLVVVRRNWVPREDLPRGSTGPRPKT
ncbi:hypothetical protein Ais01nite_68320 [Asanoa ishikariensis]|uniref:Uncharacterized protein n=1 Tax=Asanoa ishikariensis TaxID=137265 RepID=A0A1H3N7T5_9ACTN|nr:hypothetical protein [Asanoa ishikariensis]GIF68797.1 hypothetical protein Ais01nite_68320 [Asanoa ishikariensis]SDY85011.1 hypothetical protein SAMN05421684_1898 [Asanoa ishikariensis]